MVSAFCFLPFSSASAFAFAFAFAFALALFRLGTCTLQSLFYA